MTAVAAFAVALTASVPVIIEATLAAFLAALVTIIVAMLPLFFSKCFFSNE
jgi:hypothetical protein